MQDIRYAVRSLWKSRGFAVVAILCLGFGIGLNTSIFSIVDGVLLKPFPYHDPNRIVLLQSANDKRDISRGGLSYPELQDIRSGNTAFSSVAGVLYRSIAMASSGSEPERFAAAAVSWDLFPLLGIAPVVGTGFTPEMDRPGAEAVVLISHAIWRNRFASDPKIQGRQVQLNGEPAVIVGVMPQHFEFPETQKLWIPLAPIAVKHQRQQRDLNVFARLAPATTTAAAGEALDAQSANLARQYPESNEGWVVRTSTLREELIPPDVSRVIWIMMASVTLVLLIACSNVANLQLARAAARQREFSVRSALGAARGRLVRQVLTESVVLSVVSLPLSILLARIGTQLIKSAMPADQVPYYITWALDWRSLLYAFVAAVVTAVLFGLLPALRSSRHDLVESLKEGTRGTSARRSKLRSGLVIAQVSLALVSLVGALLFVRTFVNLDTYAVGFDPSPLASTRFYMPGQPYEVPQAKARRVEDIVRRVEALPRVRAAFASNLIPISGGGGGGTVVIDAKPSTPGTERFASFVGVTPHFHRTLGVSMKTGRDFTDAEGWSSLPLAIVNDTMARQFWPEGGAVGSRFQMTDETGPAKSQWFTIIGVAPDIKHDDVDPDDEPFAAAYVPYHFQETFSTGLTIRVDGDPLAISASVREALKASDPNLPLNQIRTLEEIRNLGFWEFALFGWIFGVTGIVGLLLAAVGVYGVLSYNVTQRFTEIGVRMALGAARRDVIRLIVGHGLLLAGIGVAVGVVIAPLGTWFGRSLFYNVSPFDPLTFVSVALFLLVVAALAAYVPARRATRVDPVQALRGE